MEAAFLKSANDSKQFPPPDRPEVAFAGRSNVGKSSLINRLLNRRGLAHTSSRPGKTRLINFFSVDKSLYIADLPGYGYASVSRETRQGWKRLVEIYLTGRPLLTSVVVIMDIRRGPGQGDLELLHWLREKDIKRIIVLTKADKVSKGELKGRMDRIADILSGKGFDKPLAFSAMTGQGKKELWTHIVSEAGLTGQM